MNVGAPKDKIELMFSLYDADRSGYIEKSEMLAIMKTISQMPMPSFTSEDKESVLFKMEQIFSKMDTNNDNQVSLHEFMNYCMNDENTKKIFCSLINL